MTSWTLPGLTQAEQDELRAAGVSRGCYIPGRVFGAGGARASFVPPLNTSH